MINHMLARRIATCGGLGYLPVAPGTWASLATALPVFLLPTLMLPYFYGGLFLVSTMGSLWAVPRIQAELGSDPSEVVIDEVAGMALVCCLPVVHSSPVFWAIGFFLFRVFDIVKPWPANALNRRTEGWAVLADDVVAAVYTIIALQLASFALLVLIFGVEAP